MKFALRALVVGFSLFATGCNKPVANIQPIESDQASGGTLVLIPGYKISINGKSVPVFGFDQCPKYAPVIEKLLGQGGNSASSGCIVVTPGTTATRVALAFTGGYATEIWTISRDEKNNGRIHFLRPDGSAVKPFIPPANSLT